MQFVKRELMDCEIKKVRLELNEVKNCAIGESKQMNSEAEELKTLQQEIGAMKLELENQAKGSFKYKKMLRRR
jgi:hypothetical protein